MSGSSWGLGRDPGSAFRILDLGSSPFTPLRWFHRDPSPRLGADSASRIRISHSGSGRIELSRWTRGPTPHPGSAFRIPDPTQRPVGRTWGPTPHPGSPFCIPDPADGSDLGTDPASRIRIPHSGSRPQIRDRLGGRIRIPDPHSAFRISPAQIRDPAWGPDPHSGSAFRIPDFREKN